MMMQTGFKARAGQVRAPRGQMKGLTGVHIRSRADMREAQRKMKGIQPVRAVKVSPKVARMAKERKEIRTKRRKPKVVKEKGGMARPVRQPTLRSVSATTSRRLVAVDMAMSVGFRMRCHRIGRNLMWKYRRWALRVTVCSMTEGTSSLAARAIG